ncbi:MAG: hypothetical protein H0U51_10220, partial [Propionibacteriales bacterium]|nr:hypothetical protein [Propionibacteriales bacterium]
MMPNITRGGRMSGLLAYLAGPAREGGNEHVDPHLIAGDSSVMVWHEGVTLGRESAQHVAAILDHPRRAFGTRVTVAVRRKSTDGELVTTTPGARVLVGSGGAQEELELPAVPLVKDADVWHCSLSLHADEGVLSDERWARISEQFVAKMGFADPASEAAPCRWVALRHGLSKGGNDHVHVVVSLVQEDGEKADTWNDRPRAQQAAGELEREHGLQVLESRGAGRGGRESTPAERGRAERRET